MGKLLAWLFVAGKFGKLLTTGGTMLLSVLAYSLVYGWRYAAGFVLLIFLHEMGHFIAARQRGIDAGLPMFIPFIGAWTQLGNIPHNAETSAYIGFAGPFTGTLAALGCYWLGREQGSQLLLALAYSGFILNLFNLIPILPLDGGHITAVISPKVWLIGVPLLAALFFYHPSPMLILIGILAYSQIKAVFTGAMDKSAVAEGYYETPLATRANYAVLYLGLVVFLSLMSYELHRELSGA